MQSPFTLNNLGELGMTDIDHTYFLTTSLFGQSNDAKIVSSDQRHDWRTDGWTDRQNSYSIEDVPQAYWWHFPKIEKKINTWCFTKIYKINLEAHEPKYILNAVILTMLVEDHSTVLWFLRYVRSWQKRPKSTQQEHYKNNSQMHDKNTDHPIQTWYIFSTDIVLTNFAFIFSIHAQKFVLAP